MFPLRNRGKTQLKLKLNCASVMEVFTIDTLFLLSLMCYQTTPWANMATKRDIGHIVIRCSRSCCAITASVLWQLLHISALKKEIRKTTFVIWTAGTPPTSQHVCDTYHMHGVCFGGPAHSRPFRLHTQPHRKRCSDLWQNLDVFITLSSAHNHLPCWKL